MERRLHLSIKDIQKVAEKTGRITAAVSLALVPFKIALADGGGFQDALDTPIVQVEDGTGNVYKPYRQYPQCGGEVDNHGWWGGKYEYPANHTLLVTVLANQTFDRFIYDQGLQDLGARSGECGNP